MSIQSIAAIASMPTPEPNQKNRSSKNFEFIKVPESGNISVSFSAVGNSSEVLATLIHDKGGENDVIISSLTQGGTFPAESVETKAHYYIASPDNVSANFLVFFTGDV